MLERHGVQDHLSSFIEFGLKMHRDSAGRVIILGYPVSPRTMYWITTK